MTPAIRVHDQYMMRLFQTRIREALLDARDDDASVDRLTRVWQDLSSFASLLLDVSKREELRIHDRETLAEALARLEGIGPAVPCPESVSRLLATCEGRDPELDGLLYIIPTVGTLRQCLDRVLAALSSVNQAPLNTNSGTWTSLL